MDDLIHDLDQWSRLFEAIVAVKALAPWEWMQEDDIFGLRNPKTGEIGYVSVMGMLGEHLAVAVYLGDKGLDGFWTFHEGGLFENPDLYLQVPQLQLSFEDRDMLTVKDRQVIKDLGFTFRGRQAWPWLRSYRPGYYPWYLEPDEVEFLTLALEQLLGIAPRVREDPKVLWDDDDQYLVREATGDGDAMEWVDTFIEDAPYESETIFLQMDVAALERLKSTKRGKQRLEMDFFLFPAQIGERGERPRCVYMLLIVESERGLVLDGEMFTPEPTMESVYEQIPITIVRTLDKLGWVPKEIWVKSEVLYELLQSLVPHLDFEVNLSPVLPMLDEAQASLMEHFGRPNDVWAGII